MSTFFSEFDAITGRQVRLHAIPPGCSVAPLDVNGVIKEIPTYTWSYYLVGNQILECQPMNLSVGATVIADGVDEETILGIPNPCEVTWPDGEVTTVTDGEIRFSVDLVGTYTFKLESIPHLTEEVTIEAIPTA